MESFPGPRFAVSPSGGNLRLLLLKGLYDRRDLVLVQMWTDGNAQHRIGQLFGERKIAPFPATAGVGFGQVRRNRIMDERSNPGLVQTFLQFVTERMPDNKQMPNRFRVVGHARQD